MMSEVNAYSSVYFAYENFLIRSVKVVTGLASLRTPELRGKLQKLVGNDIASQCWVNHSVEKARLIRHAIVHNGRKITRELEGYRAELVLENDEIVIMASQTTELYNLLKERVFIISDRFVKLSA